MDDGAFVRALDGTFDDSARLISEISCNGPNASRRSSSLRKACNQRLTTIVGSEPVPDQHAPSCPRSSNSTRTTPQGCERGFSTPRVLPACRRARCRPNCHDLPFRQVVNLALLAERLASGWRDRDGDAVSRVGPSRVASGTMTTGRTHRPVSRAGGSGTIFRAIRPAAGRSLAQTAGQALDALTADLDLTSNGSRRCHPRRPAGRVLHRRAAAAASRVARCCTDWPRRGGRHHDGRRRRDEMEARFSTPCSPRRNCRALALGRAESNRWYSAVAERACHLCE